MRRHLTTLALTGLFAALFMVSDASACCHKRQRCAAPCPPAPCVVAAPAPCVQTAGCCGRQRRRLFAGGGLCHKNRAVCAPAPCGYGMPMTGGYAVMPSAQVMPSGQAY